MTDYKPGDRVQWVVGGRSEPATVESGPWRSAGGPKFYVITMRGGWQMAAMAYDLESVPVRKGYVMAFNGERVTVETDPLWEFGDVQVVTVRHTDGWLSLVATDRLSYPAPEANASDTVDVDGVTYRLDREYRDREGFEWKLARVGGVVHAALHDPYVEPEYSELWSDVVAEKGPMTEVTDG